MTLFKNENQREIETLQKIEARIERREKRERAYKIIIAGMGLLTLLAYMSGHLCGSRKRRR